MSERFDKLSEQLTSIVRDQRGLPIFNLGAMYDCMDNRDDWQFQNTTNCKNLMAQAVGVAYHVMQMLAYVRLVCWCNEYGAGEYELPNHMQWAAEVTQGSLHMLVLALPRGNTLKGFPHPAQLRGTSSSSAAFSSSSS